MRRDKVFQIEIKKCRYKLQGLDVRHMWPTPSMQVEEGPILVSELDNQEYYVEDGRHRLIRAQLAGKELIDAEWYEDWLADQEAAAIKKVLAGPFGKPVVLHSGPTAMGYPMFRDDVDVATVRKNAGMPPYDYHVLQNGDVTRPRERVVDGRIEQRHIPTAYRAKCGRDHLHEAHDFGEHMEEWCNGHPAPTYQ
jgi:hypothetical protein